MENLQFMNDLNPAFALFKRLNFTEANQRLTIGIWKETISDIAFMASPDDSHGTYRFLSTAVDGSKHLTVICSDMFYAAIRKNTYSKQPGICAPGTNSRYVLANEPQHPLWGYRIPRVVTKTLRLATFGCDARIVFGSYTKDKTIGDCFRVESPCTSNHIMLILNDQDTKSHQAARELLEEWSEFHYTHPRVGYNDRAYAFILPIGFELCPKKSSLEEAEIASWLERFKENANTTYRDKCLRSLQLDLINLQRTGDPIDEELENQVLAIAKQLARDVTNPDDRAAWFHLQTYISVATRILNERLERLDSLQISSYFSMDDTCQLRHNGSPFTIDESLALIDRLKTENAAKAIKKEVEAIKENAKTTFEPKFKAFAPRLRTLGGWMESTDEGMQIHLPRTEFTEKKPYRVTTFGYCETGLSEFIASLKAEQEVQAQAKLRNDAALRNVQDGTTQSPADKNDSAAQPSDKENAAEPAASMQPTEQNLGTRFAHWFSNLFRNTL